MIVKQKLSILFYHKKKKARKKDGKAERPSHLHTQRPFVAGSNEPGVQQVFKRNYQGNRDRCCIEDAQEQVLFCQ